MSILIAPEASVDPTARLTSNITVGPYAYVGAAARIGPRTSIGDRAIIGRSSVIGADVVIGPDVRIGVSALVSRGAQICPNDVYSASSDGRTLGDHVTIGANVLIHDEAELGSGAIIPTQRTIAMIGNFGTKNRVVTIYGSDDGPRFSIGCQTGVHFRTIRQNVLNAAGTMPTSAGTYAPYLGIFQEIGTIVQAAYAAEGPRIATLRSQRVANRI